MPIYEYRCERYEERFEQLVHLRSEIHRYHLDRAILLK